MTTEEKLIKLDEIIIYLTTNDVDEDTIEKIEQAIAED